MRLLTTWRAMLRLVVAFLCIALPIGLSACAPFTTSPQICVCMFPVSAWKAQAAQTFAAGASGAFALKLIEITPQQFRFDYVFKSPAQQISSLQVAVSSSLPSHPTPVTQLATTVQTLGQIGSYTVGVIHVARRSQAGQIITLAITPVTQSGATGPTWRLEPLKQVRQEPPRTGGIMWLSTTGLPEAQWSPPVMAQEVS